MGLASALQRLGELDPADPEYQALMAALAVALASGDLNEEEQAVVLAAAQSEGFEYDGELGWNVPDLPVGYIFDSNNDGVISEEEWNEALATANPELRAEIAELNNLRDRYTGDIQAMLAQNGYNSLADFAEAYGYYAQGDINSLMSDYGYGSLEDMAVAYGYESPEAMLDSFGYNSWDEWALAQGYGTGGNPDAMLSSSGFNSWNDWALNQGYGKAGNPDAMLANSGHGSWEDLALAQGYSVRPEYNAQMNSLLTQLDSLDTSTLEGKVASKQIQNSIWEEFVTADGGDFNRLVETILGDRDNDIGLAWSHLDFSGKDLTGSGAEVFWQNAPNFTGMNLAGANLSGTGISASQLNSLSSWAGANLSNSGDFVGLNLVGRSLAGVNFSGSFIIGAQIPSGLNFAGADLSNAYFEGPWGGGNMDFTGADFTGANMSGLYIAESGGNFVGSNITVAQINSLSEYRNSNFSGLDMTGFSPSGKSLYNANLANTDVSRVNFSGSTLQYANLSSSGITIAQLLESGGIRGANLSGTGITRQALEEAIAAKVATDGPMYNPEAWHGQDYWDLNSITFSP
jgi:uncharacterized protein YjbI with pentapeptide repeats